MRIKNWRFIAVGLFGVLIFKIAVDKAFAHCDTMNGPVITAAKLALEKGDVTAVLKWVNKEQEQQIRDVFEKTLKVRTKGADAKELADMYFFETLVRLHRQGEGEPYKGLKPAGAIEPIVAASDKALEVGDVNILTEEIKSVIDKEIRQRFNLALDKKRHSDESIKAGREFVEAYIEFVHYVEAIHNAAAGGAGHNADSQ